MATSRVIAAYANRRMAALVGVGFAAGLPYILVRDTLNAWLSSVKVDVTTIGLFSLIGLPYALKFLWAPLLDWLVPPGFGRLGRRRGWLALLQFLLAIALFALAFTGPTSPADDLTAFCVFATAIVFLSASQDIVADAYRTDIVERHEFGTGAAVFVVGYRIAMIAGGALTLILAEDYGWKLAYIIMAGLMLGSVAVTLLAPQTATAFTGPATFGEAVMAPIVQFVQSRSVRAAILIVAFVLLFRLPDFLGNRMTMPLLLDELEFTKQQVGWVRQFFGFSLTIVGALVGGGLIAKVGLMRGLLIFGILQAASNAGFMILAQNAPDFKLMAAVVSIESFCTGLVAAGFVAFLMSLCDRRYSATQYAALSACMALADSIFGAPTGMLVKQWGYANFFLFTIAAGVPGLALLVFLKHFARKFTSQVEAT